MSRLSAKMQHLLLALFLCAGMIGLSGPGAGPSCASNTGKECGCCPMEDSEPCCSATEESLPVEVPLLPETRAQQQVFQAILSGRPFLFILPALPPAEFPQATPRASVKSAGKSTQAVLCVRTV